VDAVADSAVGRRLLDKLSERGLVGLAYTDLGFRHFHNRRRPIAKAEDVAGLKMRVIPTPIYVDVMNALGANAVPMPYTETYAALESGAIDGMTNTLVNIMDMKFHEVAKHLTLTNHMYNAQALIMSKKTWTSSPRRAQDRPEARRDGCRYQRKASRDRAPKRWTRSSRGRRGDGAAARRAREAARESPSRDRQVHPEASAPEFVNEVYATVEKARGKS
jgi:hypothetical protein